MASNQSYIADESGAYEDWIELYNNTDRAIRCKGLYLSDNTDNKLKWEFPDTSIPARGYLIVWADEDGKDPGLHANFKLSKSGESVYLYNSDSSLVNGFDFPAQSDDESYGRCGARLQAFAKPTFAKANDCGATGTREESNAGFTLIPNPCGDPCRLLSGREGVWRIELMDLAGRLHHSGEMEIYPSVPIELPVQHISPGLYLLRLTQGERTETLRLVRP